MGRRGRRRGRERGERGRGIEGGMGFGVDGNIIMIME